MRMKLNSLTAVDTRKKCICIVATLLNEFLDFLCHNVLQWKFPRHFTCHRFTEEQCLFFLRMYSYIRRIDNQHDNL